MSVNAKNYTKQGGELTVIGGTLRIEGKLEYAEDADVPSAASAAENQNASSATTIAGLKDNFNQLLVKLKEAGLMQPDAWNTTVRLAPSLTDEVKDCVFGKIKSTISRSDFIVKRSETNSSAWQIYSTRRVDLIAFAFGKCLIPTQWFPWAWGSGRTARG